MDKNKYETLRFPTRLDRKAIEQRLIDVREKAAQANVADLAAFFAGLETMSAPQIATAVLDALAWLEGKAELADLTKQVEIVALNLKNLKG
jgi:prophage DNA circulation protein